MEKTKLSIDELDEYNKLYNEYIIANAKLEEFSQIILLKSDPDRSALEYVRMCKSSGVDKLNSMFAEGVQHNQRLLSALDAINTKFDMLIDILSYRPEGPGCDEAKKHFESLV